MRYWLVMPAAGSGNRFGGDVPKQYLPLGDATVIEHALAVFLGDPRCQGAVVALAADDQEFARLPVANGPRISRVTGGARRSDSVRSALQAVPGADADWVLVHDAARPCMARTDLDALLNSLHEDPVGGLLAAPLADTIKRAAETEQGTAPRVAQTPSRAGLWRALTPQMFRLGLLRQALASAHDAGRDPTDESQAIEWLGHAPALVAGDPGNIKITTAADLQLASAWLARRRAA